MYGLGKHTEKVQLLAGQYGDHVEERILYMAAENVAGHELSRRHVFKRRIWEYFARHLRLGKLKQEGILHGGIHFKRMAKAHLLFPHAGFPCEGFVYELGREHGVRGNDGVVSGQVVILARVDYNAGIAVYNAGEVLVNYGALHVYIAEQYAVERVVKHNVQPFKRAHGGYFRHAQTGAIVAQADVAVLFFAHFVKRGAHQAEILLSGIGAAEAFGGRAVGHVVQQALSGGTDNGYYVRALLGGGLSLGYIFIYVAGSDYDIKVGAFLVAEAAKVFVAVPYVFVYARNGLFHNGIYGCAYIGVAMGGQLAHVKLAAVYCLRNALRVKPGFHHCVANVPCRAYGQYGIGHKMVHHHVGHGNVHLVHAVYTQQAANRALHGDRGVLVDKILRILGYVRRGLAGPIDQFAIQIEFALH